MKLKIILITLFITSANATSFDWIDNSQYSRSSNSSLEEKIEDLKEHTLSSKVDRELVIKSIKQLAVVLNVTSKGDLSFENTYRNLEVNVLKVGVHEALLRPSLSLIDSYIVNGRDDLVRNIGPIVNGLNPRVGFLLEENLNVPRAFNLENELQEKLSLIDGLDTREDPDRDFGLTSTINPENMEEDINLFGSLRVTSLGDNVRGPRDEDNFNEEGLIGFTYFSGFSGVNGDTPRGPITGREVSRVNSCVRGCIGGFVGGGFAGIPGGVPGVVFGGIGGGIAGCVSSCGGENTPPVVTPVVNDPPEEIEPPTEDTPDEVNPVEEDPEDDDEDDDSSRVSRFSIDVERSLFNDRIRSNIRFTGRGL